MSVSRIVSEIFSVRERRYLETWGRGRSRSLKMAPFDRSYTNFHWSAIVSIALCCTIFRLLSHRSRWRERLSASELSICLSICLFVCLSPKCKKTRFSQKLSNLELWFLLTTYTIRYDSVYLTCSKKLTGRQLSPSHGTNKKLKCETKNKPMSVIGPVQSHCHEGSLVGERSLRWEGFVEKVGFEPGVKE